MWRVLFGLFLVAHGLIHASCLSARPDGARAWPFDLGHSWLFPGLGEAALRPLGLVLVIATAGGFALAGLGVLGLPVLQVVWRVLLVLGAGASLLLLGLFWHPWLALGVLLSLGFFLAGLWARWPSALVGA